MCRLEQLQIGMVSVHKLLDTICIFESINWRFQMNVQGTNKKQTLRNLAIFSIIVLGCGWLGVWLDALMQHQNSQGPGLGMLLWLITPLLALLLLRSFAGDGWGDFGIKPAFKRNGVWYGLSLVIFPAWVVLILFVGSIFGASTVPNLSLNTLGLFLHVVALGLLPNFLKNIFEEFAWRGYLTPKVNSLGLNDYAGHLIVGVIWWGWHIPYYLFFATPEIRQVVTTSNVAILILSTLAGIISLSIVYGEIRLLTNSLWPAVLMHTIENAFVDSLVMKNFIHVDAGMESLVSPLPHSLFSIISFTLLGVGLRQWRRARRPIKTNC